VTAVLGPLLADAGAADFWRGALGPLAQRRYLRFISEASPKVVKNRVHLDLRVPSIEALVELGARPLGDPLPKWTVLSDPAGNEFCAFPDADHSTTRPPAQAFAVCTDSTEPEQLAAWWAPIVGADLCAGPDGTPRWLRGAAGWEELVWKFVRVTDDRVAPNRWRWSLTAVDADALLAAGACWVADGVLADPQGNEFQLD
jgi:hypothetical protein